MIQVSGFGVRNLRSLRETGWIPIRPINIFVGRNSAGKSSLARIFPLLKQSAERRKQAPLLWYGRLVDFGSFAEAVSSFADPSEIEVKLRLSSAPIEFSRHFYAINSPHAIPDGQIDATLTLAEASDGRTTLRRVTLDVFGVEAAISFNGPQVSAIRIAGKQLPPPPDTRLLWVQGAILPQLRILPTAGAAKSFSDEDYYAPRRRRRLGEAEVIAAVSKFVHGNTNQERMLEIADRLPLANIDSLHSRCSRLSNAPSTWIYSIKNTSKDSQPMKNLHEAILAFKLEDLLAELDDSLSAFCSGISYLEPLRATAQRYYRREEISVDELDPKGLNTAFYVEGLSNRDRESLNAWLQQTFGFQLIVKPERGHLALQIQVDGSNGIGRNMADVGLGYSQLAPVAIQLWAAQQERRPIPITNRHRRPRAPMRPEGLETLVVVEQPELHLHPAFQSKLADVFAACISGKANSHAPTTSTSSLRIIAETHSPNLVGRLGELVGSATIPPESISVLVFEPDPEKPGASKLRLAEFNDEGVLQNWPIGFFES